jgi:hypothetical protein
MNKIIHPMEPEELMAYLDRELSSDRTAVAAAHLSECEECHRVATELETVSQSLTAWKVAPSESTTPATVANALREFEPQRRKVASLKTATKRDTWRFPWQTAEWIGALAIIFAVVIGTLRLIGSNANNAFSQVSSQLDESGQGEPSGAGAQASLPSGRTVRNSEAVVGGLAADKSLILTPPPQGGSRGGSSQIVERETNRPALSGPMIIRTAQLALITKDFDSARSAVESILKRHRGYVGELKVGGSAGSSRTLTATLRVPADQLDVSLAELKTLGRVELESQGGQDVTSQCVDLQARLANARNTEQRLTDLLRQRTGKLSDVLEVEQEVDRARGEIEQMEAERKNMSNQVSFATLNVTITEDYRAQLQVVPPSTWTRLGNAAVAGYKSMVDGVVGLALFLLENGPSLILWCAVLIIPVRLVWKRVRRSFAH